MSKSGKNVIRRPAPFVLMSSGHGTLIVNRHDYRMVNDTQGYGVGYQLLSSSYFDPEEVDLALQVLQLRRQHYGDGIVAVDCGANVGVHTIEWAKSMFGWGEVVGIEAQERIYYALAGNVAINNCLNAHVRHAAVGASVGKLSIPRLDYSAPASFGSFELKKRANTEFIGQKVDYSAAAAQEIDLISIDSLGLKRLDFIKIDVEGMELEVLDGAKQVIEAHKPPMMVESIKTDRNALVVRLHGWGYKSFQLGINILAVHGNDKAFADLQKMIVARSGQQLVIQTGGAAGQPAPAPGESAASRLEVVFEAMQRGEFDTAAAKCGELLLAFPDYHDALHLMGMIEGQRRRFESALSYLDRARTGMPHNPEVLNNRAAALKELGQFDNALASADLAIAYRRDFVEALCNRGHILKELERYVEAAVSYEQSLELRPHYTESLLGYAFVLSKLGRYDEALRAYDELSKHDPTNVAILNNRGYLLRQLKRDAEALQAHQEALRCDPQMAVTHNHIGCTFRGLNRTEEALRAFDKAIELDANYSDPQMNRGNTLLDLGQPEQALESYDRAVFLDSAAADRNWNRTLCLLLMGDFKRGWEGYEWRWREAQQRPYQRQFTQPLWLGKEDLQGKTILLHAEQGLGDTLQFCRYAESVAARGAKVILEVQAPLKKLITGLPGVSTLLAKGEALPPFDLHCPLMSLPHAMGTTLDTVPARIPYLQADATLVADWTQRLKQDAARLKVGLVWSGRREHNKDHLRSLKLAQMADMITRAPADIRFISLQKETRESDLSQLKQLTRLEDVSASLGNFVDTAALIQSLDLVICVDTSVAHLAGALGKKVWLMLPFNPDFRWMLGRPDSPWYPSFRLYRQPKLHEWDDVITRVGADLATFR